MVDTLYQWHRVVARCTFTDVTFDKVRGSVFSPNQATLIFFPSYDFLHDNEMAHRGIIPLLTLSLISIPCQAKYIQNTDVFTKSIRMPNVRPQKVSIRVKVVVKSYVNKHIPVFGTSTYYFGYNFGSERFFVVMECFLSFVPVDKSWEKHLYSPMIQKYVPFFILKKVLIQNLKLIRYLSLRLICNRQHYVCTNADGIRERKKNW